MSAPSRWRATAPIARWLVWGLVASAVASVLAIAFDSGEQYVRLHDAFDAALDGRDREAERLFEAANESGDSLFQVLGYVTTAVLVLLIIWAWRSGHNARALGRTGERISPTLGIFGWLIPLASWVLPYLVVQDLWRSSDPTAGRGREWRSVPGAVVVRAWWACWAGAQVLILVAIGLAVAGSSDVARTDTLLAVANTIGAIGAVLAIVVVREITRRQGEQVAADPLGAQAAHAELGDHLPGEAGWYGDPGRRFERRYWDGSAWTERVQVGGVQSYAPVVPADWYPDPSGRFPLRYWTGYAWTEHVSRDEQLFVDPV